MIALLLYGYANIFVDNSWRELS